MLCFCIGFIFGMMYEHFRLVKDTRPLASGSAYVPDDIEYAFSGNGGGGCDGG
jgi:hypothetical protein